MSEEPQTADEVALLLRQGGEVERACAIATSWSKEGRAEDLVALVQILDRGDGVAPAHATMVLEHVENELALSPGHDAVNAVLARAHAHGERVRPLASRLGYAQDVESFLHVLERGASEHRELLACWMQEIVLRGHSLANVDAAVRFRKELADAGHPLAVLPLELLDPEREATTYLPLYGEAGLSEAFEALASGPMSSLTMPPPGEGSAIRTTPRPGLEDRLAAAVQPWKGPNGKVEARVFDVEPAIDELGSRVLRALPLDALAGVPRVQCTRTGAEGAFGPLFAAASNGGGELPGLEGAYGRLAAWTSFGALVGETGDIAAAAATARRCAFLTFQAAGPWFHDVAWDLGVLALRPDRASVAVLAATDTD